MSGKSTGQVVFAWVMVLLGIAFAVWFTIAALIPLVNNVSTWVNDPRSSPMLVVLVFWAVCGIIVYFLAGLFTDSVGWRVFFALFGIAALSLIVFILILRFMFGRSR